MTFATTLFSSKITFWDSKKGMNSVGALCNLEQLTNYTSSLFFLYQMPNMYSNSHSQFYLKFKSISNLTCVNQDLCSAAVSLLFLICPSQFIATPSFWVLRPNTEGILPPFSISYPTSKNSIYTNVLRMCQEVNLTFLLPLFQIPSTSQLISCDSFQTTYTAFSPCPS